MSADNGIYILQMKDQYRVAHLQAIENIYYSAINGMQNDPVSTRIVERWGNCKFTRDESKALSIALKWASKLPICEYGVNIISYNKTWKKLLEDAMKDATDEIVYIKKFHQENLYDMNTLQNIADGQYLSEWINRNKH